MTNKEAIDILNHEVLGIPSDVYDVAAEQFEQAVRVATRALESVDKIKDEAERVKADNIILTKRLNEANSFVKAKANTFDYYRDGYKSGFEDGFVKGLGLQNTPNIKPMLNGEEINQEGTK